MTNQKTGEQQLAKFALDPKVERSAKRYEMRLQQYGERVDGQDWGHPFSLQLAKQQAQSCSGL